MLSEFFRSKALMQRTDDLHTGVDLSCRLELTETFITGRNDLRQVFGKA